jgi:serpin B
MSRQRILTIVASPAALALALLTFAGCNSQPAGSSEPAQGGAASVTETAAMSQTLPAGNAAEAARANNKFAWALWSKAAGTNNAFISPTSVSQALSMTAAGAEGATSEELWTALGFAPGSNRLADQGTLVSSINKVQSENLQLQSANALWVGKNETLKPDYTRLMAALFAARVENLDFAQAAKAAATINAWVESKTNKKIKDLVPASVLGAQTRMVLTNAVYFKADWAKPFKKEDTAKAPFKVSAKETRQVDMMNGQLYANYAEDDVCQVAELPYKGNRVVMRVILPKEGAAAQPDAARVAALMEKSRSAQVHLSLPKFKIEWSGELTDALKGLGVKRAFDDGDFTGMFAARPAQGKTQISAVIHKTYVQVDELGTEAAAATAVVISLTSAPGQPTIFKADHPFLFQIIDKETDTILFMGRLSDPTK